MVSKRANLSLAVLFGEWECRLPLESNPDQYCDRYGSLVLWGEPTGL